MVSFTIFITSVANIQIEHINEDRQAFQQVPDPQSTAWNPLAVCLCLS